MKRAIMTAQIKALKKKELKASVSSGAICIEGISKTPEKIAALLKSEPTSTETTQPRSLTSTHTTTANLSTQLRKRGATDDRFETPSKKNRSGCPLEVPKGQQTLDSVLVPFGTQPVTLIDDQE